MPVLRLPFRFLPEPVVLQEVRIAQLQMERLDYNFTSLQDSIRSTVYPGALCIQSQPE